MRNAALLVPKHELLPFFFWGHQLCRLLYLPRLYLNKSHLSNLSSKVQPQWHLRNSIFTMLILTLITLSNNDYDTRGLFCIIKIFICDMYCVEHHAFLISFNPQIQLNHLYNYYKYLWNSHYERAMCWVKDIVVVSDSVYALILRNEWELFFW